MRSLKPVRWKEGLFLRPHHLQQFDLYIESREYSRLRSLESHSWGMLGLKLNTEALDNYTLDVSELQVVMPDGSLIDVPGNARLSTTSFEKFLSSGSGGALDVHVGVRAREERRPQVVEGAGGQGISRFCAVENEVLDMDTGDGRAPIEYLQYDLRAFFGDESQQGYDTLPLLQLVGTGDPAHPVAIDPDFAPPSLILYGSSALSERVRGILERLALVQRELQGQRHSLEPGKLVIYQAVCSYQPVLRDMLHDGMVHPRRVYHELARLVGSLLAVAGRSPDEVPAYDHRRPGPVFETLRRLVEELTPTVIQRRFHRHTLQRSEDEYSVELPEDARNPAARCFLEAVAEESTSRVPSLLQSARASSSRQMETLQRFALLGVPTEVLPGPPPEVGDAKGSFFRLKQEHEEWSKHVIPDRNLTVVIRDAPEDLVLNLIVVPPKG